MKSSKLLAVSSALAALCTASALHAQTRVVYVDASAPGGNGATWASAYRSLTTALNAINAGTVNSNLEIRIAQGTYRAVAGGANSLGFQLAPRVTASAITISVLGAFGGLRAAIPDARDYALTPTVLSSDVLGNDTPGFGNRGDNAGTVLRLEPSPTFGTQSVHVDGVICRGSSAAGCGITFGTFRGTSNIVSYCTLTDNQGGGFVTGPPNLHVDHCVISNNAAGWGAGIECPTATTISDCVISGNVAMYEGGGLRVINSNDTSVERCVIAGNVAGSSGGGIYVGASTRLTDCLIVANQSGSAGGGIYARHGNVLSCTIVGNGARWGGGIHVGTSPNEGFLLYSSVLARNTATDGGTQLSMGETGLDSFANLIQGGVAGMFIVFGGRVYDDGLPILDADPRFVDESGPDNNPATWQDNNYHLRSGSPCINAGWPSGTGVLLDLDGHARRQPAFPGGPAVEDLGCYEYTYHCPADIDGNGGVTVDDLIAYLSLFAAGAAAADLDDGSQSGAPDGGVTVDDLLFFLARFAGGC